MAWTVFCCETRMRVPTCSHRCVLQLHTWERTRASRRAALYYIFWNPRSIYTYRIERPQARIALPDSATLQMGSLRPRDTDDLKVIQRVWGCRWSQKQAKLQE